MILLPFFLLHALFIHLLRLLLLRLLAEADLSDTVRALDRRGEITSPLERQVLGLELPSSPRRILNHACLRFTCISDARMADRISSPASSTGGSRPCPKPRSGGPSDRENVTSQLLK